MLFWKKKKSSKYDT